METKITKTNTWKFDELTDEQKQTAISQNFNINVDYEWWDYEDFKECGRILGIKIDKIYFSGFSSQGDGACFEGSYSYSKQAVKKIKEHAPLDTTLHTIADGLLALQKECMYQARAKVKQSGHYMHENCTQIDTDFESYIGYQDYYTNDRHEQLKDLLRDFMRWMYSQLNKEYDYRTSEEAIAETLRANDYDLTIDGKIF